MDNELQAEKMPHMFKPNFKKEEIEELLAWFETRMDKLPKTMKMDPATETDNLPLTVERLIKVLSRHKGNFSVTFCGYMALLLSIRQRLQEQGIE